MQLRNLLLLVILYYNAIFNITLLSPCLFGQPQRKLSGHFFQGPGGRPTALPKFLETLIVAGRRLLFQLEASRSRNPHHPQESQLPYRRLFAAESRVGPTSIPPNEGAWLRVDWPRWARMKRDYPALCEKRPARLCGGRATACTETTVAWHFSPLRDLLPPVCNWLYAPSSRATPTRPNCTTTPTPLVAVVHLGPKGAHYFALQGLAMTARNM